MKVLSDGRILGKVIILMVLFLSALPGLSQEIAVLKYEGGGDWYANPTGLPNLIRFCNENLNTRISEKPATVETQSRDLFTDDQVNRLRTYLMNGGFLWADDDFGMDYSFRREMKKVFPDLDFQEIPVDHPIYKQTYSFEGLPKIHKHHAQPPQGFGLFYEGRLLCFYDYESDLSDGWEDEAVHNDPPEVRIKALQMGSNIIEYAFKN